MVVRNVAVGLTPTEAAALAPVVAAGIRTLRDNGRAVPELVDVLAGVLRAVGADDARAAARAAVAGSATGSAPVPLLARRGTAPASSPWLTVRQTAELVGVSERAIRKDLSATRGRLRGRRRSEGSRAWEVDPSSAREWQAARQESA